MLTTIAAVAAGAALGAWARAAVFRFAVRSDQASRTSCPTCGGTRTSGGWPVLSPLGRCPRCQVRIGPAPMSVEAATAAVFGLLAWHLGAGMVLLALLWAGVLSVALSFVDGAVHRLPDPLVLLGIAGTLIGLSLAAILAGSTKHLISALVGAAIAGVAYFLLVLAVPRSLGLGDAKLAVLVGLATGWFGLSVTVFALIAGMVVAGLAALGRLVARRAARTDHLAHGPYMLVGALLAVLLT